MVEVTQMFLQCASNVHVAKSQQEVVDSVDFGVYTPEVVKMFPISYRKLWLLGAPCY